MDSKWQKLIKSVLQKHLSQNYQAFIFGSRAQGTNRPYSDIDLGILGNNQLSSSKIVSIKNDLEESRLPYRVDLVDFQAVSDKFRNTAMRKMINL